MGKAARLVLGLAPALFLMSGGCYLLRQAGGQLEILIGQEDAAPLVESDRLTADEARKMVLIAEAREFAFRALAIAPSDNYTTFYDTRGKPVSFVVSGCRKDSFQVVTWSFPIVGAMAYKGFFRREDAVAEATSLEEAGYDATIHEVAAYSTLGWFRDPIFSSMLRRTEADLVALIIHELSHGTVYAPGHSDFNEELATFVGVRGAVEFLAERYGAASPELERARAQFHDDELFDAFLRGLYERLDELYQSSLASEEKIRRREEVFAGARAEFARLKPRFRTPAHNFFERMPLNNAEIAAIRRYGGYALYDRVFARAGGSWVTFFTWMRLAAVSPDPSAAVNALADGGTLPSP